MLLRHAAPFAHGLIGHLNLAGHGFARPDGLHYTLQNGLCVRLHEQNMACLGTRVKFIVDNRIADPYINIMTTRHMEDGMARTHTYTVEAVTRSVGAVASVNYEVIRDDGAKLHVSRLPNADPQTLTSFGGDFWPASVPELFEHVGPDKNLITWRSGPAIRRDALCVFAAADAKAFA